MQVVSPISPTTKFVGKESFAELYGQLNDDFSSKLKVGFTTEEEEEEEKNRDDDNLEKSWWNQDDDDEREKEEDEEFSFTSVSADNSSITADEAFEDGQIRPVYPLFNRNLLFEPEEKSLRSPLKKLFVESEEAATETEEESEPIGPYCSWSGKTVVEQASPESCRKSNSTGFSKLWRFKDLVSRSSSDGKDAFVFLNHGEKKKKKQSSSKLSGGVKRTEKEEKKRSAHERLYMRNRAIREEGRRRSYLPYKHVGFFTNVNGLTRNVHPY